MLTATEESQWFKWSQYWLFLLLRLHTWPVAALSALAALSKYCISIKCGNKEPFIVHMYKICSVQIVDKSCIIYSRFIWKQIPVDQLTGHNDRTTLFSLRLISNVNCVVHIVVLILTDALVAGLIWMRHWSPVYRCTVTSVVVSCRAPPSGSIHQLRDRGQYYNDGWVRSWTKNTSIWTLEISTD